MSVANDPLRHDRWRPRGIGLPIVGGFPGHQNSVTAMRDAHRAEETPHEPLAQIAAGIDYRAA